MSGRKRWPVYRQPEPRTSVPEDFIASLKDALARTVDATRGAFAKMRQHGTDRAWIESLNADEVAVVAGLLALGGRLNEPAAPTPALSTEETL